MDRDRHTQLDIKQSSEAVEYAFETNIPILLWGEPGV